MGAKRLLLTATLLVTIGVIVLFVWKQTDSTDVAQIDAILRTPQTYDGEQIDKLVQLGPESVPAIGEVLSSGDAPFPLVLVYALEKIGDPRGAEPILEFIRSRPLNDSESSAITAETIRALGSIQSPSVCGPLRDIFENISAQPAIRLASAKTVSLICDGQAGAAAEGVILEFYNSRHAYLNKANEGFSEPELYSALVAVGSEKTASILVEVINTTSASRVLDPVIESMDRNSRRELWEALPVVVTNPDVPFETRLLAAERLTDQNEPSDWLQARIEELITEAEVGGYPLETIGQARQLRTR